MLIYSFTFCRKKSCTKRKENSTINLKTPGFYLFLHRCDILCRTIVYRRKKQSLDLLAVSKNRSSLRKRDAICRIATYTFITVYIYNLCIDSVLDLICSRNLLLQTMLRVLCQSNEGVKKIQNLRTYFLNNC